MTLRAAAAAYVEAARGGSIDAGALASALAERVLEQAGVQLALDILDGDVHWGPKALQLASMILLAEDEESAEHPAKTGGAS